MRTSTAGSRLALLTLAILTAAACGADPEDKDATVQDDMSAAADMTAEADMPAAADMSSQDMETPAPDMIISPDDMAAPDDMSAPDMTPADMNMADMTPADMNTPPAGRRCEQAGGPDCTGMGYCYNIKPSTCEYLAEKNTTVPECAENPTDLQMIGRCVSSVQDLNSPYATEQYQCPLVQHWSNPTRLDADCRCGQVSAIPCQRPYNLNISVSLGSGPRPRNDIPGGGKGAWGGFLEGREMIYPITWSDSTRQNQTLIYAVNIDTGARRRVSGAYQDPQTGYTQVGAGDAFLNIYDVRKGPDNNYYAMGSTGEIGWPRIWRVDPQSGDRTLVFNTEDAANTAQCANGLPANFAGSKVLQPTPESWTMDDQGRHYFAPVTNTADHGFAIVRYAADGSTCEFITRVPTARSTFPEPKEIGTGWSSVPLPTRGLSIKDGKLYAISDTQLIEIEIATGNRRLISNAKPSGGLGTGPINAEGMGDRWTIWDPHRDVMWTVGAKGGTLAVAVDLATGDRATFPCWHPTAGMLPGLCNSVGRLVPGPLNFGAMVIDPLPPHDLFFAHDIISVVRHDTSTGNTNTISL
jgi:hypothetical protein